MKHHTAKRRESTAAMRAVRPVLAGRCGGYCEVCGLPLYRDDAGDLVFDAHHRKLRRQGGQDTAENLLVAHHICHLQTVHSGGRRSYDLGWMVRSYERTIDAPVLIGGRRCLLLPDGRVTDLGEWAA